ncbi:MAG: transcriptional regulator [Victivallales bacterium]|jgi:uncharacterized protein|nr:transcriptional regulator [Victivallales bacterium]
MKTLRIFAMVACFVSVSVLAYPRPGGTLSAVRLNGKTGGLVSGGAWTSNSMVGKVRVVFYVDPDEKELNDHVGRAIDKAELDQAYYGSVAIIKMGATWMPGFAVGHALKAKQKQYPRAVYVKDLKKQLVKRWGLADHGYDVIVLDAQSTVLYYGRGKLSEAHTKRVVDTLRDAIAESKKNAAEAKTE